MVDLEAGIQCASASFPVVNPAFHPIRAVDVVVLANAEH